MLIQRDPRLLTAAAALAASAWPAREQSLQPYKPHRVAERAARELADFAAHPAVQQMGEAARHRELTHAFAQALDPAVNLFVEGRGFYDAELNGIAVLAQNALARHRRTPA